MLSPYIGNAIGKLGPKFDNHTVWGIRINSKHPEGTFAHRPQIHQGTCLTDLSAVRSDINEEKWLSLPREIAQRKIYGLEMEGVGLYQAVQKYNQNTSSKVKVLLAKGVSDLAYGKNDGYHKYAKQVSAAFIYHFIRTRTFAARRNPNSSVDISQQEIKSAERLQLSPHEGHSAPEPNIDPSQQETWSPDRLRFNPNETKSVQESEVTVGHAVQKIQQGAKVINSWRATLNY